MSNIGPLSPSTMADDATIGNVAWTNPNNAKVSDNVYATSTLNYAYESHYLKATNFGFSIPTGTTINGIVVETQVKSSVSNTIRFDIVKLIKGGIIGGNSVPNQTKWSTSEAYIAQGSSSNLWGNTLTPSDINDSTFGVAIVAYNSSVTTATASVDHIRITVYYTVNLPTVTTQATSSVASITATGNGNITVTGGVNADQRGVVYSLTTHGDPGNVAPASSDYSGLVNATGSFSTGAFTMALTGLTSLTTYYTRAYAHNSVGYSYGSEVNFTTGAFTNPANVYGAGYATCAADSGVVSLQISKDAGTNWSVSKPLTLTTGAGDTTLTYGGVSDNWGIPLTGADINSTTNFLVRITCGTATLFQQDYKNFGFAETAGSTVLGVKAVVVAKYVAGTPLTSIDSLTVTATVSSSDANIIEGSTAYDSTLNTLTAFNGTGWVPLMQSHVGMVITSTVLSSAASVQALYGGTWAAFGAGRVIVGKAASGTFNTAGATGGAETHTNPLSDAGQADITISAGNATNLVRMRRLTSDTWTPSHAIATSLATGGYTTDQTTGAGLIGATDAGSSLQPYVVAYQWERTA